MLRRGGVSALTSADTRPRICMQENAAESADTRASARSPPGLGGCAAASAGALTAGDNNGSSLDLRDGLTAAGLAPVLQGLRAESPVKMSSKATFCYEDAHLKSMLIFSPIPSGSLHEKSGLSHGVTPFPSSVMLKACSQSSQHTY